MDRLPDKNSKFCQDIALQKLYLVAKIIFFEDENNLWANVDVTSDPLFSAFNPIGTPGCPPINKCCKTDPS
jgi:hypothetical protein